VPREVQLRRLEPSDTSQLMAHAADPRTILALSRDVFGEVPQAWLLTIPAVKLEFSERLSEEAQRGCAEAVERIRTLRACKPMESAANATALQRAAFVGPLGTARSVWTAATLAPLLHF